MVRMLHRVVAVLLVVLALAPPRLKAQTPYGTPCSLPANSFGGSGIPTNAVFCSMLNGTTIALAATPRYTSPPVTTDGAGTYFAQPGISTGAPVNTGFAAWNFDYFVGGASLSNYFALFIDLNPGPAATPALVTIWNGNAFDSSNLGYFGSTLFDPNATGQYTFDLRNCGSDATCASSIDRVAINVDVGNTPPVTSTPEPATLTLLATGLAGVVGVTRRRKAGTKEVSLAV